jgi:mannosylglycoprotein endo-beta-mannosidase
MQIIVKEGDANAQFFRTLASARRRRNHIATLRFGETVAHSQEEKEDLATSFYNNLFGGGVSREHDLSLAAAGLPALDLSDLEAAFTVEESWTAIKDMPANRAPGPDGFSWDFYKSCWPIIRADVFAALQAVFLGRGQHFGEVNGALITLLPKKEGAVELTDFRPISLVHSFAKLLAKILASRLAPKLPLLVAANQSAFVRGRCIHDNFVLVQQSARALYKARVPSLLLKLDIARAFDSVSWPFLISVLRQRGFGPRWIAWITLLLCTASTRVVINGSAGAPFAHGRGLRQGDPISPLLFIVVMNVVSAMFSRAEERGVLSDLRHLGIRHRVSLYADDVVVFSKPCHRELEAVFAILRCFGAGSGLMVNYSKSVAIPIRCSQDVIDEVVPTLACPIGQFPCRYLGLPLSLSKPTKTDVQPLIDKLARMLPFWKARLLTREGRLSYVQTVMTASAIYPLLALDVDPWVFQVLCPDGDEAGHQSARSSPGTVFANPNSLGGSGCITCAG